MWFFSYRRHTNCQFLGWTSAWLTSHSPMLAGRSLSQRVYHQHLSGGIITITVLLFTSDPALDPSTIHDGNSSLGTVSLLHTHKLIFYYRWVARDFLVLYGNQDPPSQWEDLISFVEYSISSVSNGGTPPSVFLTWLVHRTYLKPVLKAFPVSPKDEPESEHQSESISGLPVINWSIQDLRKGAARYGNAWPFQPVSCVWEQSLQCTVRFWQKQTTARNSGRLSYWLPPFQQRIGSWSTSLLGQDLLANLTWLRIVSVK